MKFASIFAPINPSLTIGHTVFNRLILKHLISSLTPHQVQSEDQHSWKECEISISELSTKEIDCVKVSNNITSVHICTRGDCMCLRITKRSYSNYNQTYIRSGGTIWSSERPDCFGDTPINEQTID